VRLDSPAVRSLEADLDLLVLDTQPTSRAGVASVLRRGWVSCVLREADSATAALTELARRRPSLVILELNLNGPSGLDFVRQMVALHPRLRMLVFSSCQEEWYADRALRAGARGYVMKSAASKTLLEAVAQVLAGRIFVSPAVADLVIARLATRGYSQADQTAILSDRELEVFLLIGNGIGTAEIARRLRVSVSSVECYRAGIKRKLNFANGAQLVRAAVACVLAEAAPRKPDPEAPPRGDPVDRMGADLRRP